MKFWKPKCREFLEAATRRFVPALMKANLPFDRIKGIHSMSNIKIEEYEVIDIPDDLMEDGRMNPEYCSCVVNGASLDLRQFPTIDGTTFEKNWEA